MVPLKNVGPQFPNPGLDSASNNFKIKHKYTEYCSLFTGAYCIGAVFLIPYELSSNLKGLRPGS